VRATGKLCKRARRIDRLTERQQTMRRRFLVVALVSCARAQDPLAGSYFDGGGAGAGGGMGGGPMPMSPGGFAPESPRPVAGGGGGWGRALAFASLGAGCMKAYDASVASRTRRSHEKGINALQTSLAVKRVEAEQLVAHVQTQTYQIKELQRALYDSEAEALQRDYEEFKAPDVDGDDKISIYEFGSYIQNYMKAYPHIPERDYPTFADFDKNGDGTVTFKEWQHYLQQQKKDAKGSTKQAKASIADLSKAADSSQSFQQLYEKLKNA